MQRRIFIYLPLGKVWCLEWMDKDVNVHRCCYQRSARTQYQFEWWVHGRMKNINTQTQLERRASAKEKQNNNPFINIRPMYNNSISYKNGQLPWFTAEPHSQLTKNRCLTLVHHTIYRKNFDIRFVLSLCLYLMRMRLFFSFSVKMVLI